MRPTFMGFETAKSAIFTNQKSLDIVGNNLSNVNTNGYTRQRADRTSLAPSGYSTRVSSNRVGLAGQGVETVGVSQMRDEFLDKRFRDEFTQASYHAQSANILQDIQSAISDGNDITDESGLYGAMSDIVKNLNGYIQEPTMETQANLVMSSFKNITQVLQQLDFKLNNVADQQIYDLQVNVDHTNDILQKIAHLNEMIGDDATVTNSNNEYFRPNELLDQRNLLLDELASYGDISVKKLANGKVNVDMGGHQVIREDVANGIQLNINKDKTTELQWRDTGEDVHLNAGGLLASQQYINGRGNNASKHAETPQQGIPYYRDRLDTFAGTLAQLMNNTVPELSDDGKEPKKDANGNIVYKTLLGGKQEDGTTKPTGVTAGNISISDQWTQGGAGYFIYNKSEDVEDYAQQISFALTEKKSTFDSYGEKFVGTFTEYEVDFLGKLGADLSFQNGRHESTALVTDDFLSRRDEISGVSRDEETADMLRYQKSYEAAARLMTTLDEVLDVMINRMGRVGL